MCLTSWLDSGKQTGSLDFMLLIQLKISVISLWSKGNPIDQLQVGEIYESMTNEWKFWTTVRRINSITEGNIEPFLVWNKPQLTNSKSHQQKERRRKIISESNAKATNLMVSVDFGS